MTDPAPEAAEQPDGRLPGDPTWADYREDAFGEPYDVWHDGPSFEVMRDRFAEDPELASRMLVAGIAEGDAVAAQAVAEMDLTPEQRSHLAAALIAVTLLRRGDVRIAALRALGAMGVGTDEELKLTAGLIEELQGAGHWGERFDAAIALRDFPPTPPVVAAVTEAVATDEDYLVRYHSANTLLRWAGVEDDIEDADDATFGLIAAESSPEKWREAADKLSAPLSAG